MTDKKEPRQIPLDKYYRKWGMPIKGYFSRMKWSFIETEAKKTELYIPPYVWNKIVHEILYTELKQYEIAEHLHLRSKYIRAVYAELRDLAARMERLDMIGPGQYAIFLLKINKRQTQAQIAEILKVSRQRVSEQLVKIEEKFKKSEGNRPRFRGGVDTNFAEFNAKPLEEKKIAREIERNRTFLRLRINEEDN